MAEEQEAGTEDARPLAKRHTDTELREKMEEKQLCEEAPGVCTIILTAASILMVLVTLPVSLCLAIKVVQDYERVVIFRLGRILGGGARGPGLFFVLPCTDIYEIIDMRVILNYLILLLTRSLLQQLADSG
jgi:hypothetical protein